MPSMHKLFPLFALPFTECVHETGLFIICGKVSFAHKICFIYLFEILDLAYAFAHNRRTSLLTRQSPIQVGLFCAFPQKSLRRYISLEYSSGAKLILCALAKLCNWSVLDSTIFNFILSSSVKIPVTQRHFHHKTVSMLLSCLCTGDEEPPSLSVDSIEVELSHGWIKVSLSFVPLYPWKSKVFVWYNTMSNSSLI